jgi:Tfp pilus assembly protein PilO
VTRTNKILLVVVGFGLAVAAFWFLVLAPKREEVAQLDKDIAAKEAEVATAQRQLATYEQARASYKHNYATLARLGKAVPADDDVRSLMVQLQASAEGSGVTFEKIELGSGLAGAEGSNEPSESGSTDQLAAAPGSIPVASGALSAMPFSFTFTGGYFDLTTFFAKLEHFVKLNNEKLDATGRLLRVESFSINPSTKGFPLMQAEVGAATYVVPPVQGVEGAPAPNSTQNAASPSSPSPGTSEPTTTATAGAAQ